MTPDELIRALREKESRDNRELLDAAADMLERQRWIPVAEELPPIGERVIVARVYDPREPLRVEQGTLTEGGWWKVYGANTRHVEYWMPMPEPPETIATVMRQLEARREARRNDDL